MIWLHSEKAPWRRQCDICKRENSQTGRKEVWRVEAKDITYGEHYQAYACDKHYKQACLEAFNVAVRVVLRRAHNIGLLLHPFATLRAAQDVQSLLNDLLNVLLWYKQCCPSEESYKVLREKLDDLTERWNEFASMWRSIKEGTRELLKALEAEIRPEGERKGPPINGGCFR